MIKTKDELLNTIKTVIGDDTSDDAIKLIEDFNDTIDDLNQKANGDGEDWKTKYEQNDAEWRNRYRERFFNPTPSKNDEEIDDVEKPSPRSYNELFKES